MFSLVSLAMLPGILIIIYIFKKDKVEKEPVNLIVKMVVLGALSCVPAAFLEGWADNLLPQYPEGSLGYAISISFLSAGLIEEFCKFAFLRAGIWRNREFDYSFDGVVYGVSVAAGFAMLENILYVLDGGISVAITRAFLSVPLHAFCGAFMGAFFGMAKKHYVAGSRGSAAVCQLCAVIVPVVIHGIYDTFAFLNRSYASVCLLAFTALLYVIGITVINRLAKDDWKMAIYSHERQETFEFVRSYEEPENVYGYNTVKATNGLSIAGLICGIISYLTMAAFVLPSILAIIFSLKGRKNTPQGVTNMAANAGLVMGITSLILNAVIYYRIF